jgi:Uma2 family endonuclease
MAHHLALKPDARMTEEEFLAFERAAEFKHEYVDGYVYAMAGASRKHNLINGNVARHLGNQFAGQPCEVYSNDMRVWLPRRRTYTYPDVVVVCGEPRFLDNEFDTLLNPLLIIEVLSPSTKRYNFNGKFRDFRTVESCAEYVLIAQDQRDVAQYAKRDGLWTILEVDDRVEFVTLPCVLTLDQIYERVEFEAEQPENAETTGES